MVEEKKEKGRRTRGRGGEGFWGRRKRRRRRTTTTRVLNQLFDDGVLPRQAVLGLLQVRDQGLARVEALELHRESGAVTLLLGEASGGSQGPAREASRAQPKRAAPKKPQENPHDVPETTQEAPCTQEASQLSPPEKPSMTC